MLDGKYLRSAQSNYNPGLILTFINVILSSMARFLCIDNKVMQHVLTETTYVKD